jgi:hypothetical protein
MSHLRHARARALLLAALGLPAAARAADLTDGHGNLGRTSYTTLPFANDIYKNCNYCSPYLEPGELYFQDNPSSYFNNPADMQTARGVAAKFESEGILPTTNQQRWEDTYEASFDAVCTTGDPYCAATLFPGEPAGIIKDRVGNGFPGDGAFVAWRDFIFEHPQYWDTAFDGGTMPSESDYYRAWGGQWGYISPLTPLDPVDCPPGQTACTWGDMFAYRWAQTAALTGAFNISLSDFADSQPQRSSNYHDFNPRIVTRFAQSTGLPVPSAGVPTQAQWIVANASPAWNDFLAQGYATFFQTLSAKIGAATGRQSLVIDQCGWSPSYRRWFGTDQRIIASILSPSHYLCLWDDQMIQTDRLGPLVAPPMQEVAGYVLAAAREPLIRNGANIEADDSNYWSAIAQFYPTLGPAAQTEIGDKLLKRLWLWSAWAHVADRAGTVRRALAFTSRDYSDSGSLAALGPLTTLIQTITPAQPFGAAVYYSTAVERARELQQGRLQGAGAGDSFYLAPNILQAFIDAGGGAGYYVSDAALGQIGKGLANAPSAWIMLDTQGQMPASERNRLAAIAPIATTPAVLSALPNQPLAFTGGLTGFGFYDPSHRLIIVVSNPGTQPGAGAVAGTIKLSGLAGSQYTVTDLFTHQSATLAVGGGHTSLPVTVSRWNTCAFVLSPSQGAPLPAATLCGN